LETIIDISGGSNTRKDLYMLAAALEVCERNGVYKASHVFALGKTRHALAMEVLLADEVRAKMAVHQKILTNSSFCK